VIVARRLPAENVFFICSGMSDFTAISPARTAELERRLSDESWPFVLFIANG